MIRTSRLFDGPFGRILFLESDGGDAPTTTGPLTVLKFDGPDVPVTVAGTTVMLGRDEVALAAPHEALSFGPSPVGGLSRLLLLQGSVDWLRESFPKVFAAGADICPLANSRLPASEHVRRLADALCIEMINDRFLAADRLRFMAQELMLSIVEVCVSRKRAAAGLWEGSRYADSRIRRAIGLLRARPNKELSIDRVAKQVGLSRSRFYDLFQVFTGRSPREYLDLLCVGNAITALAKGESRISELSAELGFSAQSNFTRFFLHRVGVPPSEYRKAATHAVPADERAGAASPNPDDSAAASDTPV